MERIPFADRDHIQDAIRRSFEVLENGGVIMVPTETFYGLAARPDDEAAVQRILAMKGRPAEISLPVLVSDWQQLEALVVVPRLVRGRLSRLWPSALTVVLPSIRKVAAACDQTLAIRIPGHDMLRALLYRIGPVTGTSANRHASPPNRDPDESLASLFSAPDLVLDGGLTNGGEASTLVDLTEAAPVVLRQGNIKWFDAYPETS